MTDNPNTPEAPPRTSPRGPDLSQEAPDPRRAPATLDADVAHFIAKIKSEMPAATKQRGRLIFAMDATMSRAPTWDLALNQQSSMFAAVRDVGGLDVQLVYFRGFGECRASKWVSDPDALAGLMTTMQCRGGQTQLARDLSHARSEAELGRVNALVYVGDAMEESVDAICSKAGELSLQGVPVFLFQEGMNTDATAAFKEIARITRGAHCMFDEGSARQLRELLTAVAVYAAGGRVALERLSQEAGTSAARLLLGQIK